MRHSSLNNWSMPPVQPFMARTVEQLLEDGKFMTWRVTRTLVHGRYYAIAMTETMAELSVGVTFHECENRLLDRVMLQLIDKREAK